VSSKANPNPPSTFASGGQKPFREKVSGLTKAFHWYGLDTLFFFVYLCVPLWLKLDGGFGSIGIKKKSEKKLPADFMSN
jgi:hypothetical protein